MDPMSIILIIGNLQGKGGPLIFGDPRNQIFIAFRPS